MVLSTRKFESSSDILVKEMRSLSKIPKVCQGLAAADNGGGFMESCLSSLAPSALNQSSQSRCAFCISRTFLVGKTAGTHDLVAVCWSQSMSLMAGLSCEYACS